MSLGASNFSSLAVLAGLPDGIGTGGYGWDMLLEQFRWGSGTSMPWQSTVSISEVTP